MSGAGKARGGGSWRRVASRAKDVIAWIGPDVE